MPPDATHSARLVLTAFLLTFIFIRLLVYAMGSGKLRNHFISVGGTHVHHLNIGIFSLSAVGAYLIFWDPAGSAHDAAALVYGFGMGLTYDEFGMWLHLEDNYWQRASWDAVAIVASLFGLAAFAPALGQFQRHHWIVSAVICLAVGVYLYTFLRSALERRRME